MSACPQHTSPESQSIYKVAIVAPTCFYYQIPLFRMLAAHARIELTVYFCSEGGLYEGEVPEMYKTKSPWGVEGELVEGYEFKFLRNYSPIDSYRNRLGLVNPSIWNELRKNRPDVVVFTFWMNPTWWVGVLACLWFRIPSFYMTDTNLQVERAKGRWQALAKKILLGKGLFRLSSGFLCSGEANRQLFRHWGVPDKKLVPFAYSWGYQALLQGSDELKLQKQQMKAQLGIPDGAYVILFCGRLSKEKRPMDLLEAYRRVSSPHKALIFVGDGELRPLLQDFVDSHSLDSVSLFGFQDRREIPRFYAISDVLVLPSSRETWGMVVNEAMCFGLPVVVSDQVGAASDLVMHGKNGFIFPAGDVEALANNIKQLMELSEEERSAMGTLSSDLIKEWSERDLGECLVQYLDSIGSPNRSRVG